MPTTFTTGYGGNPGSGPYQYFTGTTPSSLLVPSGYPVALDGQPFILDDRLVEQGMWLHESIPLLRQQQDQRDTPGEQSVNPAGYWRRAQEDWTLGTDQAHYDRPDSVPQRFADSKNVDPFGQEWELSLLREPEIFDASSYIAADQLTVAGTYLYATQGTELWRSDDTADPLGLWHDFGSTITSVNSDGYWVFVAAGTDLFRFARDAAIPGAAWSSGIAYDETGVVKDRVIAGSGNLVYEIDAAGVATVIYTGPSPDWGVVDITEGEGFIWFAAGAGDRYSIYSIDVLDDGTGLAPPAVAAELPEGEIATACEGYLNFIFVGVDVGVRLGVPNRDGDITLGALIDIGAQVESFEGQAQFVRFEWDSYDLTSSGIGVMDLSRFTDAEALVPAYATNFMVEGATHINSIVRRSDELYFLAVGVGLMKVAADSDLVEEGSFESGWINWNLVSEEKQLAWVRLDTNGDGTYLIEMKQDDGDYKQISLVSQKRNRIPVELRGLRFQYRISLRNAGGENPILFGVGLEAYIAADTTARITVPLLLADGDMYEGAERYRRVSDALSHLKSLRETRNLTTYQEGPTKYTVIMEDYRWIPSNMIDAGPERGVWNGTFVAQLKEIDRSLGTESVLAAAP